MTRIDKIVIVTGSLIVLATLIWIFFTIRSPQTKFLPDETPVPVDVRNCEEDCVNAYLKNVSKTLSWVAEISTLVKSGNAEELLTARTEIWDLLKFFDGLKVPIVFRKYHADALKGYLALANAIENKIAGNMTDFNWGIDVSAEYLARAGNEFSRVMIACGYNKPGQLVACGVP